MARPWSSPTPSFIDGDLGLGNVLVDDDEGLPPAVIDFSPYWQPAGFALAVLVADALAWQDAPDILATQFAAEEAHGAELLARAAVYRVATGVHLWGVHAERYASEVARYGRVAALAKD